MFKLAELENLDIKEELQMKDLASKHYLGAFEMYDSRPLYTNLVWLECVNCKTHYEIVLFDCTTSFAIRTIFSISIITYGMIPLSKGSSNL